MPARAAAHASSRSTAIARDPPGRRARRADRRRRGRAQGTPLVDGDCLVVTQKIVSKAEGRLVALDPDDLDARRRARRVGVGADRCAGAATSSSARPATGSCARTPGIDLSNVDDGWAALLPVDADRSAKPHPRRAPRRGAASRSRSSSPTRSAAPWRHGLTDVAIGVSGHRRGRRPARHRRTPRAASSRSPRSRWPTRSRRAAELVMGKAAGVPAAIVRGLDPAWFREGRSASSSARPPRTCSASCRLVVTASCRLATSLHDDGRRTQRRRRRDRRSGRGSRRDTRRSGSRRQGRAPSASSAICASSGTQRRTYPPSGSKRSACRTGLKTRWGACHCPCPPPTASCPRCWRCRRPREGRRSGRAPSRQSR